MSGMVKNACTVLSRLHLKNERNSEVISPNVGDSKSFKRTVESRLKYKKHFNGKKLITGFANFKQRCNFFRVTIQVAKVEK